MPAKPSQPQNLRAVIFDFDGVIADTVPLHYQSYKRLFEEQGKEYTWEEYQKSGLGASRAQAIRSVMGKELDPDQFQELMNRKSEIVLDTVKQEGLNVLPGALELVRALHNFDLKVGLASSSGHAELFLEIIGVRFLFHSVQDVSQNLPSKPAPDLYLEVLKQLNLNAEEAIAIEDSPTGVQSAKSAGLKILGVTNSEDEIELEGADWQVPSLRNLSPEKLIELTGSTAAKSKDLN